MATELKRKAHEESTYIIRCDFEDEDGDPVTPATMTWKLTDRTGAVINSRTAVDMSPSSSTEYIVLTGADLVIADAIDNKRFVYLKGTYNSTTHGNGLAFTEELVFEIEDFVGET